MSGIRRRTLLAAAGGMAAATAFRSARAGRHSTATMMAGDRRPEGWQPNIILLFTDQQRQTQHWPDGWAEQNLPSETRLKQHGISFTNTFIAASECTPSRAAMLTGTYPAVTGVTQTFYTSLVGTGVTLQTFQNNLARLMATAGYDVVYKGKWHESFPAGDDWSELDIAAMQERYGFAAWNPPDAGNSLTEVPTAGGGRPNNDGRYMSGVTPGGVGQVPGWGESVVDFIEQRAGASRPFCLFVSLVNPHDVGFFPTVWKDAGYELSAFQDVGIDLPSNIADPLEGKPSVQGQFRNAWDQRFALQGTADQRAYANFYAYLHTLADRQITTMLDALDAFGMTEDTIIVRFADHGEMGLSHGLRQKMYTAYEEMIHVPLIVSNPVLFDHPVTTDAFASLIDIVPTITGLAGIPLADIRRYGCVGFDLAPVLANPAASVRNDALYTYYDGVGLASILGPFAPNTPAQIAAVRERDWLYAVYFTPGGTSLEYELYDLQRDPGELDNLASEPSRAGTALDAERQRLHRRLTELLVANASLPRGFRWPLRSGAASA